jgi:pentatricopeptide repeat protein
MSSRPLSNAANVRPSSRFDEREHVKEVDLTDYTAPTPQHKAKVLLSRKVEREYKKIYSYIDEVSDEINNKLELRMDKVMAITNAQDQRLLRDASNIDTYQRFIFEVDDKIDDVNHAKAIKRHSQQRIQNNLPSWFKSVTQAIDCAKSNGHSNKLKWRSKVCNILKQSILESEDDTFAVDSRIELRNIVLVINTMNANELNRRLEAIKANYISDQNDKGTRLGHDSTNLVESKKWLDANDTSSLVPLSRDNWSSKLQEYDVTRRSMALNSTTTISTLPKSIRSLPTLNTLAIKDNFDKAILQDKKDLLASLQGGNSLNKALISMRVTALSGDFQLTYSIFKKTYEKPIINGNKHSIRPGKHLPNNLYPFKVMMVAFKNDGELCYNNAFKIMDMIKSCGLRPDVMIYNIMMKSCVKNSKWRRSLSILHDMQHIDEVIPNALTFEIILDCCRHALDEPAEIYDTLRYSKLPKEFCYKAAVCNAGNRISHQVLQDLTYDVITRNVDVDKEVEQEMGALNASQTLSSIDSFSQAHSATFSPNKSTISHGSEKESKHGNILSEEEKISSRNKRDWEMVMRRIGNTLPRNAPALIIPGKVEPDFELQVAKQLPADIDLVTINEVTTASNDAENTNYGRLTSMVSVKSPKRAPLRV